MFLLEIHQILMHLFHLLIILFSLMLFQMNLNKYDLYLKNQQKQDINNTTPPQTLGGFNSKYSLFQKLIKLKNTTIKYIFNFINFINSKKFKKFQKQIKKFKKNKISQQIDEEDFSYSEQEEDYDYENEDRIRNRSPLNQENKSNQIKSSKQSSQNSSEENLYKNSAVNKKGIFQKRKDLLKSNSIEVVAQQIQIVNDFMTTIDDQEEQNEKLKELEEKHKFICRECIKPYPTQEKFEDHMIDKHPALSKKLGIANYFCTNCEKRAFKLKKTYQNHVINCFCQQKNIELTSQQKEKILVAMQLNNSDSYKKQLTTRKVNIE